MKKRCTNSACRKVFHVDYSTGPACPYCGRMYTRILAPRQDDFGVYLSDYGQNKIAVIKVLKVETGLDLAESKAKVESCPCIAVRDLSQLEAHRLCRKFVEAGARAKVKY